MAHLGGTTPTSLVNAAGPINRNHQIVRINVVPQRLRIRLHQFVPGTIVRLRFKGGFYLGTPELCEEEGVYKPDSDFQIIGFDTTLSRPAYMPDINSFWNEPMIKPFCAILRRKNWPKHGARQQGAGDYGVYAKRLLHPDAPGQTATLLELAGVQTVKTRTGCSGATRQR